MHAKPRKSIIAIILISTILLFFLGGCAQPMAETTQVPKQPDPVKEEPTTVPTNPPQPTPTQVPPTEIPTEAPPTETPTPDFTPTPEVQYSNLPPAPQLIEFQAEDGKNLVGYYYPSVYADAPVLVLMHWAGGNQRDWCVIAPWLQNRLDESSSEMPGCSDAPAGFTWGGPALWWDSSWFPQMPEEVSYAVFTFDFRDYGESQPGRGASLELTKDALAALVTASGLDGIDPMRIVTAGASIGSDGAPDGCLLFNQSTGGGCLGALSLSPGSYLDMPYKDVVAGLDSLEPAVPVWCLAAEFDGPSPGTCNSATGDKYRIQIYEGMDEHGMMLVDPQFDPDPLTLLLEFLSETIIW